MWIEVNNLKNRDIERIITKQLRLVWRSFGIFKSRFWLLDYGVKYQMGEAI
jgi:hypothetical protein